MRNVSLLIFFLLVSCAHQRGNYRKLALNSDRKILDVPFIPQKKYHCGPASLSMVMRFLGDMPNEKLLRAQTLSPKKQGTLTHDLLGAARRQGYLAIPIHDFSRILREVSEGHPLIVFQNLGLSWFPQWHFAVVIGYDLKKEELILHSGKDKKQRMTFTTFLNTWERGEKWALMLDHPGNIPQSASELEVAKAAASLEESGHKEKAVMTYQTMLKRWEGSYMSLMGLGNIYFQDGDFKRARTSFLKALSKNPHEAYGWHNLAIVEWHLNKYKEAKRSAHKALKLASMEDYGLIQQNLAEILK